MGDELEEVFKELRQLIEENPDLCLSRIFCEAVNDTWYAETDEVLILLRKYRERRRVDNG